MDKAVKTGFVVLLAIIVSRAAGVTDANALPAGNQDLAGYYGFGEMEIIKLEQGIGNLKTGDFNGDGRSDIVVVNNLKARIEVLVQAGKICEVPEEVTVTSQERNVNILRPPTRYRINHTAISQRAYNLVCGDLNSDGLLDLAFYGEPKGLYVILQKADKKTTKPAVPGWESARMIEIEDGLRSSSSLVCSDFNNDGRDDLALVGTDSIYIVLQDENGGLSEPLEEPSRDRPRALKAGDLDGDGLTDMAIITSNHEKPLRVRFGLSNGQLGPEMDFSMDIPWMPVLADIDANGGQELIAVDRNSGRLMCYRFGDVASGEDGVDADGDWPVLFYPLEAGEGSGKRDLVVADIDGDLLEDVVVSDPGAAELIVYMQKETVGLSKPVRFPALSDITELSSADIDGDGAVEIGLLSVKEKLIGITRWHQDRLIFPRTVQTAGEPLAMQLTDIDGDGNVDCVYVAKQAEDVRVMRVIYELDDGNCRGTDVNHLYNEWLGTAEQIDANADANGVELKGIVANPSGLRVVDVDQDGLKDVLVFVPYDAPILIRQVRERKYELIKPEGTQSSLIKEAKNRSVAVGETDGRKGCELLIAQDNFARSLIFREGKKWEVIDQYNARSRENEVSVVGTFDVPGGNTERPSIVLLDGQKGKLQILEVAEGGTYRFDKELDVGKWSDAKHLKIIPAELTGDGAESLLLFDGRKFSLVKPPAPSAGEELSPVLERKFIYQTLIKEGLYGNVTAGDINNDGRIDIIALDYKGNNIEILALGPNYEPVPAMRFKVFEKKTYSRNNKKPGRVEPREMQVVDVTGDGKSDLITVIHDRIIIYPQD